MESDFFISMLEDEDDTNASIALRELLKAPELDKIIATHQDDDNPLVCKRIHQLVSMRNRQRLMDEFPEKVNRGEYSNWEALATINVILDPQTSFQQLDDMVKNILEDDFTPFRDTKDFCDTIRELNFVVEENSDNFIVKYLLLDAMVTFTADPLVVAVICQKIGLLCKWKTAIGYLDGKLCLLDRMNNICSLSPNHPKKVIVSRFKPISVRDIVIELLAKIHSAASIDQVSSVFLDTRTLLERLQA